MELSIGKNSANFNNINFKRKEYIEKFTFTENPSNATQEAFKNLAQKNLSKDKIILQGKQKPYQVLDENDETKPTNALIYTVLELEKGEEIKKSDYKNFNAIVAPKKNIAEFLSKNIKKPFLIQFKMGSMTGIFDEKNKHSKRLIKKLAPENVEFVDGAKIQTKKEEINERCKKAEEYDESFIYYLQNFDRTMKIADENARNLTPQNAMKKIVNPLDSACNHVINVVV